MSETKDLPVTCAASNPFYMLRMCLIESRPSVQFMFTLRYLSGAALCAQAYQLPAVRVLLGGIAFECAIFSVYLFNGTMDLFEDRANGSLRPIAAGKVQPATAQCVAALSAVASLAVGFAVGALVGLFTAITLCLGYAYSGPPWHLKRTVVGSALCGSLGGLASYAAGAAAVTGALPAPRLALFPVALSLWIAVVGSTTKDLSDVAGDAIAGRRTVAVVCGEKKARFAAGGAALVLGTGFAAITTLTVRTLFWPAIVMECGALMVAVMSLPRFSAGPRARRRKPYRMFMATQYATHLALLASLA